LETQLRELEAEWRTTKGGLELFDKLLAMAERETRALTAAARALRLTPQAQMHPRTAGRQLRNMPPPGFKRPWDE
jgi:hypothetical protein